MPRRSRQPLPTRDGLGPTKIVLGKSLRGVTLAEALSEHSGKTVAEMIQQCDEQQVVDFDGKPLAANHLVNSIMPVFIYRVPLPEVKVPFDIKILAETERFIIIDKPHFLATIPRGMHITETVLIRLRRSLNYDTLSPAHRLDRLTAGLLLLTTQPQFRGSYQQLFAQGKVQKVYRALAQRPPVKFKFPIEVHSRIEKTPGIMRAYEVPGAPNAHSTINYLGDHPSGLGEYELKPSTGKTHQLRMHMWKINLPIWGDPLYPIDLLSDSEDFSTPLHLRAHKLAFIDPYTSEEFSFESTLDWILDTPVNTTARP